MGLCQGTERGPEDARIRVYSYNIKEGKTDELKSHLTDLSSDAASKCDLVAIGIDTTSAPNQLIFASFAKDAATNEAFMTEFQAAHKDDLASYTDGVKFQAKGSAFSAAGKTKGMKPVSAGQFIRIVKMPADKEKVTTFSKAVRAKMDPEGSVVPGMQCSGYALGEEAESVHGYQCFDSEAHADAYTAAAKEIYADQQLEKTNFVMSCGEVIYAQMSSGFLGLPMMDDIEKLSNMGRDGMDNVFLHLPGGSYIVDGTTFVVDGTTNIGDTVVSTASDGTTQTWQVTTDGLKVIPGGSSVVEGAETVTKATVDAGKQGAGLANQGVNAVVEPAKSVAGTAASTTASGVKTVADADPTGAVNATKAATAKGSQTLKETSKTATPDVGTKGMAQKGANVAKGKDEKGNASCVVS